MYLKTHIILLAFALSILSYNNCIYANDFEDGIGIDDGIPIDDTLTPDVNFSFIKRNAINKAKAVAGTTITETGAGEFLDSGDLFVNSVLIDPGSVINGDITIIINEPTTAIADNNR